MGSSSLRSFVLHPATRSEKGTDMQHSAAYPEFACTQDSNFGQTVRWSRSNLTEISFGLSFFTLRQELERA
jgi:hypothetical protein